jgi:hypothetical protein
VPRYAEQLQGTSCQGSVSIHALGGPVSAPSLYTQGSSGACTPSAAPGATFYGIGAEIAASEFVAASLTSD